MLEIKDDGKSKSTKQLEQILSLSQAELEEIFSQLSLKEITDILDALKEAHNNE